MTETFAKTGQQVGPYVLMNLVGRGGFSEVWQALGDRGEEVAVKLLIHPEHLAQLRQEANALSLVRGEGIVAIHGMGLHDDPPWIALELLRGGNLRQRMRRGHLPSTQALILFEGILDVLGRVHREGIVHGDLKPENVLFTDREVVNLADFGLSRRIAQRSASLSVSLSLEDARLAGTLDYMAPEQRSGEKPTARSDVFAAGVLLYELLTGERPQGVFKMPSEIDPSLPPVVDRLIACSLAQDPRHRFASAAPMLAFLRAGVTSDWKELAKAQKRLEALVRLSAAGQAHGADTTLKAVGIALGTMFIILVAAGVLEKDGAWLRFFAGCGAGIAAVALVARLARPWLGARYATIRELKTKVELQIRTGGEWSRAVAASSRGKPSIKVRPVRGGRTSPVWPPRPQAQPSAPLGGRGVAGLAILGLVLLRTCAAASRTSSPPPYYTSPPPSYSRPAPFVIPPVPDAPAFEDVAFEIRTRAVEHFPYARRGPWTEACTAIAATETQVFAGTSRGFVSVRSVGRSGVLDVTRAEVLHLAAACSRVAVAGLNGAILVFDATNERPLLTLDPPASLDVRPTALALSADGRLVAFAIGASLRVVEVDTGRERRQDPLRFELAALAFDDETLVGLTKLGHIIRWNAADPRVRPITGPGVALAQQMAIAPGGRFVVAQRMGGWLKVVDARGRSLGGEHPAVPAQRLAVSDDGERVLLVDHMRSLHLYEPRLHTSARLGIDSVSEVRFAEDGSFVTRDLEGGLTRHRFVR